MPAPSQKKSSTTFEYRGSLLRIFVIGLLALSLLPLITINAFNYLGMRRMLKDQTTSQLTLAVENYTSDYQNYASRRRDTLHDILTRPDLRDSLLELIRTSADTSEYAHMEARLRDQLKLELKSPSEELFSSILLLDTDGDVVVSTRPELEFYSFRYNGLPAVIGSSRSIALYNPAPVLNNDLALFTSEVLVDERTGFTYTLVGVSKSEYPRMLLDQAEKFFNGSNAYLFTRNNIVIGLNADGALARSPNSQEQSSFLEALIKSSETKQSVSYVSQGEIPVLSYARWIPSLSVGFVVEVPEATVYEQTRFMGLFLLLIMLVSILSTGFLFYFGLRNIIRPLKNLATSVQRFTEGEWTHRVKMGKSGDEIGLLGFTFNRMADELSKLYRSLETKVEERNQQLRAATDVAQVVTSTIDRKDMLKQTVELLCERFYIDFAGIYLLDSSKTFFSEKETAGRLRDRDRREGMGMRIRTQSIFGKAIASKQPQLALAPSDEGDEHPDNLLPDTLSGIVIPITMGDEILGLLEAQSLKRDTFPPETVSVLKMLANQLGNGLQNVRLIENAQVDLHETALLYQASRRVSQSRNPDEITQVLQDTISRTDYMGVLLDENEGVYSIRAIIDPLAQALERNLPKVTIPGQRLWDQLAGLPYVLIDNLSQPNDLFALTTLLAIRGCHSAALLPIYGGGKVISILALGTRKDTPPAASDLEPYLNMIEVAANTLEHLRIVSTLENNLSELQTLSIISQTISEETELGQQTAALREQIIEMFNGKVDFAVALYDPAQDKIAFPRTATNEPDLAPSPVVPDEKLISAVIKSRKSILSGSQEWIDQTDAARRSAPTGSWLGIPLLISGHPIGAMAVWDPETEDRFSEENLQFFNDLAAVVAINIRNTQLLNQTQATLKVYHQEHFLLNNLLENIPGVVTFKDRAGQYLRVSRIAAQARGYQEPAQMEGKTEVDLLPTETGRATHQVELDLMAKDESQRDVIEHLPGHIDGERWWLSSRLPIKDEEEDIVGLLSISQDITTLKETEQLAQKRASQLRTTSEIARDASSTLNVEELLSKSVNLIRDRFGYYHASIFLNDPLDEYTILRESTGEAGRQMKMAGHRLAIGLQSVVGSCADQGKPLVVNDVSKDPNYYANPMLPGTRSELAIPLKTGERVIGVIDVQSSEVNAFQPDDIQILQILADQIAVALVNADMYVETQENVTKHRFLHQITSAASGATRLEEALSISVQGLRTAMACDRVAIYLPNQKGDLEVQATAGYEEANAEQLRVALGEGLPGQVALDRQPILIRDLNTEPRFQQNSADMRSALAVPILYSDRSAGVLVVESARTAAYDENDQEILASLGGNLGAILANAQLVAQVRQQVEQQKKLFEITSKIRRSGDIKTILETSARELAKALHARRATIEVLPQEQPTSTDTSFSDPWNPGRENER